MLCVESPSLCMRPLLLTCIMQVPRWQSWLVQTGVALRTRLCNMPYGDQALFVRKSALQTLHVSCITGWTPGMYLVG